MAITINGKTFDSIQEFAKYGRGCATKIPTPIEILRIDEEISINKARRILFDELRINVKFIHITYGSNGLITKNQRSKQINLLNKAFRDTGIKFYYKEKDVVFFDNYNWYKMRHGSYEEREAKTKLSSDSKRCLNFYTGGLQKGLLGWATFPCDLLGDSQMDGVVVLDESLPNGNATPYNLGMTAVHEVGHWLGLYHTFQGGCEGIGDYVNDTPAHDGPNYGRPKDNATHNACNSKEFAPIHNYMNYVNDEWMNELTINQAVRIKEHIMMYRTGLLSMNV